MIKLANLFLIISSSTEAFSYVLGPVPSQELRIKASSINVRPPLTNEACYDDCIKNYYSIGVQENLFKYHEKRIFGNSDSDGDGDGSVK